MEPGPLPADPSHGAPNGADALLICGLGALGQACLERLLGFAVPLTGVDLHQPVWRSPELERAFQDRLILGDMRQAAVLQRAGVEHCRAVLLLSQGSQVNLEAALQVRLLNPDAELVVRASGQEQSLGHLLEQRLPRLAVVNPLMLTAAALAAALHPDVSITQLTAGAGDATGESTVVLLSGEAGSPSGPSRGLRSRDPEAQGLRIAMRTRPARSHPSAQRQGRWRWPRSVDTGGGNLARGPIRRCDRNSRWRSSARANSVTRSRSWRPTSRRGPATRTWRRCWPPNS